MIQPIQMTHSETAEIGWLLSRNIEIVQANCIAPRHPLLISAVGEMAINLRECISAFEKKGIKCRATHDLSGGAADVASMVVKLRHSFCHSSTTKLKDMDDRSNRLSWGFLFGPGILIQMEQKSIGNPHSDDVGVCMGDTVVLIKRHMMLCHNYYARALDRFDNSSFRRPVQIFADEVVEGHAFWSSQEYDLS